MVSWNGDQILVDDKRFDMDGIRTVVHGLVEAVRDRLYAELMLTDGDTVPTHYLTKVYCCGPLLSTRVAPEKLP
jgi:hypothetical protein